MRSLAAPPHCTHAQASSLHAYLLLPSARPFAASRQALQRAALPAHAEINALRTRYWVEVDQHGNPDGHTAFPAARRPSTWPLAWPKHAPPAKRLLITYKGSAPLIGQPHGLVVFLGRCVENASAASLLRGVQELTLNLKVRAMC
jgi:hypothetical protein